MYIKFSKLLYHCCIDILKYVGLIFLQNSVSYMGCLENGVYKTRDGVNGLTLTTKV